MVDADLDSLVISVVYDGPPRAGKTTSVRALASMFGRDVYTPEERNGRTVYFDWVEHVGGVFEGKPIRFQIASVPGQRHWTRRRGHFLDRADVVVFVGDTTTAAWPETIERLAALRRQLDARSGTPVGLVFQANKRDCDDAVSIDLIHEQARSARTAVHESIAETGVGVREAFVFAVRLAVDRVRAETTYVGRSGFGPVRGTELVALLQSSDEPSELEPPALPPPPDAPPRPPTQEAPSGYVWPPVEGRIVLREAAATPPSVRVTATGDCVAETAGWAMHSSADAVFDSLELARARLLAWARTHATVQDLLSRRRCIVVAETGAGQWRLWQVVRATPALCSEPHADSERILAAFARACEHAPIAIPCSSDTVGIADNRAVFVGLMPLEVVC